MGELFDRGVIDEIVTDGSGQGADTAGVAGKDAGRGGEIRISNLA
jgi:hypothetical protein